MDRKSQTYIQIVHWYHSNNSCCQC